MSSLSRFMGMEKPDFSQLPCVVMPLKFPGFIMGVVAFVATLLGSIFLLDKFPGLIPKPIVLILPVIAFVIARLLILRRAETVTMADEEVFATHNGVELWRDHIQAFDGVLWQEVLVEGSNNKNSLHQIVELRHATISDRSVELLDSQSVDGVRKVWEDAARALNLPAIRETAEGWERRNPDELDTSLADRVRTGQIEAKFDPESPSGISWSGSDGEIAVTIRPEGRFRFILMAFGGFGLCIVTFVLSGFFLPLPVGQILILVAVVFLTAEIMLFGLHCRLRVTPQNLSYSVQLLGGFRIYRKTRALDTIESAAIVKGIGLGDMALRIETDGGDTRIALLTPEGAEWLRSFLMSALAEAPD